jgi:hypothetical protein
MLIFTAEQKHQIRKRLKTLKPPFFLTVKKKEEAMVFEEVEGQFFTQANVLRIVSYPPTGTIDPTNPQFKVQYLEGLEVFFLDNSGSGRIFLADKNLLEWSP